MKRVILLGSTGSIGCNAIKVIKKLRDFKIVGLAAYANHQLLSRQAAAIQPKIIAIIDKRQYVKLKGTLSKTKILSGENGITEMVDALDADIIICALASSLGIFGIIRAIEKKMRICLATKEILVSYGEIIMPRIRENRVKILPIDSEHSAIYQCLEGRDSNDVLNVILTASGGPFLKRTIKNVRKSDVMKHPVWKMGTKITVDSATMMNKGLEVIEAHHLFNLPPEKIKVVVHPEALCHSLVQFRDGTLLAQFSTPDMRLPIQYALTAPARLPSLAQYLDIAKIKNLTFFPPNLRKFRCLRLAYEALNEGKSMPAVLNAANEETVKLFLDDKIKFHDIPLIIAKVMKKHEPRSGDISDYKSAELWAKEMVRSLTC